MNWFLLILIGIFPPGDEYIQGDLNVFYLNDSTSYVEYVYFISPDYLKTLRNRFFDLKIEVGVFMETGKKITSDSWKKRYNFKKESSYIADMLSFILNPGIYKLSLNFKTRDFEFQKDTFIEIEFLKGARTSDIQIIKNISTEKDRYPFKRYNLSFLPAPYFSYPDSFAYYYFEIYNSPFKFLLSLELKDSTGKVWLSNVEEKRVEQKMGYIYGKIPLFPLKAGEYTLKISIMDTSEYVITGKEKSFSYFSQKYLYKKLATEKYEDYLSFIDFFATKDEMDEFKSLKREARITFLKKFWKKFDTDPETPVNEFLVVFINRVKYADENFGTVNRRGRYTDRGRIYIKYGPPDEVRRNPYPLGSYAWESWFYRNPTRNQYIFIDLKNDGNYRLIYSSDPEEPGRADWRNYVPQEEIEVLR